MVKQIKWILGTILCVLGACQSWAQCEGIESAVSLGPPVQIDRGIPLPDGIYDVEWYAEEYWVRNRDDSWTVITQDPASRPSLPVAGRMVSVSSRYWGTLRRGVVIDGSRTAGSWCPPATPAAEPNWWLPYSDDMGAGRYAIYSGDITATHTEGCNPDSGECRIVWQHWTEDTYSQATGFAKRVGSSWSDNKLPFGSPVRFD